MWIARNKALPQTTEFAGLRSEGFQSALLHYGWTDAVVVGSELMHYSMDKLGSLVGLGSKNIIEVPAVGGSIDLMSKKSALWVYAKLASWPAVAAMP